MSIAPKVLDPDKTFMLECVCHSSRFTVIVAGDGVTCVCISCYKRFKIESIGGVRLANA